MAAELLVSDLMDKKFNTIRENDSINKAIRLFMEKSLIGLLVVNDQNELVGSLTEKDCLKEFVQQTYHALPAGKVKDYMGKTVLSVPGNMTIKEVADVFLESTYRRLPVLEDGKLIGQITRRDFLRGLHLHFFPENNG